MAKNGKQLSREELELYFEKENARKEADRHRQALRRQQRREAGIRSYTFWGSMTNGLTPVMIYTDPDIAEYIKKQVSSGKLTYLSRSVEHQGKQLFALVPDARNMQKEQVSPQNQA